MKYFTYRTNVLVVFFAFLLCGTTLQAAPAYPGMVKFRQPDGTEVNVFFKGDEVLKWAETEDGYSLMYDKDGFLVYATSNAEGDMVPSELRATDVVKRPSRVANRLRDVKPKLMYSKRQIEAAHQIRQQMQKARSNAPLNNDRQPVVGKRKFLVILMEFPDRRFTLQKSDFEALMNQVNYGEYGSVRDFYLENSFGKLDLTSDVAGVYMADNSHDYYGGNDGTGSDANPQILAKEAVEKAEADVNFSDYDNDGDGVVDGVHIIFAGYGEEAGGGSDCIWAHKWSTFTNVDGKKVSTYSCSPELSGRIGTDITNIGVICHEIGHVLGCMDYYDTNYQYGGEYEGTGIWDVMASGSWNKGGACPPHFNPYVKIYDFGWAEVSEIDAATSVTLQSKSENGFVRLNTVTDGEYFLLEYRSQTGFDASLPGHGLMVYRAGEHQSRYNSNQLNAYHKQQFYPLCANAEEALPTYEPSSYGEVNRSSAPFPGTLGKTELSDATTPAMLSWNGQYTNLPINAIEEYINEEHVAFDIAGGKNGGAHGLRVVETDVDMISLTWKNPNNKTVMLAYSTTPTFGSPSGNYTVGDVIEGGGKIVYTGTDVNFVHTGLESQTKYYYKLYSLADDNSWIERKEVLAVTQTGQVIHKFPFLEDFEGGVLADSWTQTVLDSDQTFEIHNEVNTPWMDPFTSKKLVFNAYASEGKHAETIIISPIIDFTGCRYAMLSFNYYNRISEFEVLYRSSEDEGWNHLASFENGIDTAYIELNNLTSKYQLAFRAEFTWAGSSKGSDEILTIDDLLIKVSYPVKVLTENPTMVSSTFADIPLKFFEGEEKIIGKGVAWSSDDANWVHVKATNNDFIKVDGLPKNTTVYYKAYVKTENGIYYGDVKNITTHNMPKGEGTEENPFLIANVDDWNVFRARVNQGDNCTNVCFALAESLNLASLNVTGTFNGKMDGCGHKISGLNGALFSTIEKKGVIKNLEIENQMLAFAGHNYGEINNCNVYVLGTSCAGKYDFGGLCTRNYGEINNCSVKLSLPIYASGYTGGICGWNFGFVSNCYFEGTMFVNNNGNLGGIAGSNSSTGEEGFTKLGVIRNCRTKCNLSSYLVNEKAWYNFIGGITGFNTGLIEQCYSLFEGNAVSNDQYNGDNIGGVVGYNNAIINDVYCCSNIQSVNSEKNSVGGLVGKSMHNAITYNAFCISDINCEKGAINKGAFSGYYDPNKVTMDNCYYYSTSLQDVNAQPLTLEELKGSKFLQRLNAFNNVWTSGIEHPVLKYESEKVVFAVFNPFKFTSSEVELNGFVTGQNLVECGIEWKKSNSNTWIRQEGCIGEFLKLKLTGLDDASLYTYRIYAENSEGEIKYSEEHLFATLFESKGSLDDPHLLTDAQSLRTFRQMVYQGEAFENQIVRMTQDVDLEGDKGYLWEPIYSKTGVDFYGEIDGAGKIIKNMKIKSARSRVGFFAEINASYTIHDFHIENGYVECLALDSNHGWIGEIGGIAGYVYGKMNTPKLKRCSFQGEIHGGKTVGGVFGYVSGDVEDCYSTATIYNDNNSNSTIGGLIGKTGRNCINSYFAGDIIANNTDKKHIGGIIGYTPHPNSVSSSYYVQASTVYNSNVAIMVSKEELKSESIYKKLSKSGNWSMDNAIYPINFGYPVLKNRDFSRIITLPFSVSESQDIVIKGVYVPSTTENYDQLGFEWYAQRDNESVKTVIVKDKDHFEVELPNSGNMNYFYRAFATAENADTLFGEWKTATLSSEWPRFVVTTTSTGDGTVTGEGTYYQNSHVTLIAKPAEDETLEGWYDGALRIGKNDTCHIMVNKDMDIVAKFVKHPFIWGDVNKDKRVTVGDVVTMVNHILMKNPKQFWFAVGDINKDNRITTSDVVSVIDIVLTSEDSSANTMTRAFSLEWLDINNVVEENGTISLPVALNNAQAYSAFQMDVTIPKGLSFKSAELTLRANGSHAVSWRVLRNGKVRIFAYSPSNTEFNGMDGDLVNLVFEKIGTSAIAGEVSIDNAIFVTSEGEEHVVGNATSILNVEPNEMNIYSSGGMLVVHGTSETEIPLYNVQGYFVRNLHVKKGLNVYDNLLPGVYIVNQKKIIVE